MNAKLCKRLRREARAITVGLPLWRLTWNGLHHWSEKLKAKIPSQTLRKHLSSFRGVYRAMKRGEQLAK